MRYIGFITIIILISLVFACDQDDDLPIPKKELEASDLYSLVDIPKKVPCGQVPPFGPTEEYFGEYFRDSFVYYLATNKLNKSHVGFGILEIKNSFNPTALRVYHYDLESKNATMVGHGDMSSSNLTVGGPYLGFSKGFETTLFDTRDNSKKSFSGNSPSISPDGKWLQIREWNGSQYEPQLISLETDRITRRWNQDDGPSGFVLWRDNSCSFIYSISKDGDQIIMEFDVETDEEKVLFSPSSRVRGLPSIWISETRFVTSGGSICDEETKNCHDLQEICESDEVSMVANDPFSENFIIRKTLLDIDSSQKVVSVHERFFLANEKNQDQDEVNFVF